MKQTEIGLIPEDWEVRRLGDVGKFIGGGTPNTNNTNYWKGTIPWISSSDISKDSINTLIPNRFITKEAVLCSATKLCPKNTILIVSRVGVGKIAISNAEVCTSQDFTNLVCNNIVDEKFVAYQLLPKLQQKASEAQGTSIKGITTEEVKILQIPIPPLAEQKRIAKALSDVDALISTTEKLIQKKKNIKQGAMQNLLTGKKRLLAFAKSTKYKQTELGPIPEDWEVKRLSEFGAFCKGSGISREESNTGELPAVRYGELYTTHNDYIKSFYSHISDEVASKSRMLKNGDLLFTCSGETKEEIGKCVSFIGKEKAYAGGDLLILSPTINIDSLFYGFLLNTNVVVKQKKSMAQGDAVVHISTESIGKIQVPFPSKEEQIAIADVLSSMDKEIGSLETKLEKYRNLKTAMMQQLLTGKIRL